MVLKKHRIFFKISRLNFKLFLQDAVIWESEVAPYFVEYIIAETVWKLSLRRIIV